MSFQVIVTLGPAIMNPEKLKQIDSIGNCIYRINGAHIDSSHAVKTVEKVRDAIPTAKIMIDLPGNKIRVQGLPEPIKLIRDQTFELFDYQVNYQDFFKTLTVDDMIYANDSEFRMEVREIHDASIKILPHSNGLLLNNKGLHVQGIHDSIPFLFDRDTALMQTACEQKIDFISLSFVRNREDIQFAKEILSRNSHSEIQIIAKIETASAVENLESILDEVEMVNVDRGDLSTDIGIINLGSAQLQIIKQGLLANKKIFLATQFLKNMERSPVPSIAEVIDLHRTIIQGVSGIQLSEETAVGEYPVECVKFVFDLYSSCTFEALKNEELLAVVK